MGDDSSVSDVVATEYAAALEAVHGKWAADYAIHRAKVLRIFDESSGPDLMLRAAAVLQGNGARLDAYVRSLIRRHGVYAAAYTRRMAKDILALRDVAGHDEWMRMAEIIERSNDSGQI
jgi:hypothetical protein